jgi:hypothetical protein
MENVLFRFCGYRLLDVDFCSFGSPSQPIAGPWKPVPDRQTPCFDQLDSHHWMVVCFLLDGLLMVAISRVGNRPLNNVPRAPMQHPVFGFPTWGRTSWKEYQGKEIVA